MTRKFSRRPYIAALAVGILLAGCSKSSPSMHVDDAVQLTEDTLTTVLLGNAREVGATSLAPPDPPLLVKGVHDKVYIAADEDAFVKLSRGSFSHDAIQQIRDRVVKDVDRRLQRHDFSAVATDFPPPDTLNTDTHALIATITPQLQETGSPRDRAQGKSPTLVLIQLKISDAVTGIVLSERDYYSGNNARPIDPNAKTQP